MMAENAWTILKINNISYFFYCEELLFVLVISEENTDFFLSQRVFTSKSKKSLEIQKILRCFHGQQIMLFLLNIVLLNKLQLKNTGKNIIRRKLSVY